MSISTALFGFNDLDEALAYESKLAKKKILSYIIFVD